MHVWTASVFLISIHFSTMPSWPIASPCPGPLRDDPEPACRVRLRRDADRATVRTEAAATFVRVESRTGIGGATLSRSEPGAPWPDRVEVVLPLRGLEGLTLRGGEFELVGSVTRDTPPKVRFARRFPDGREEPLDDKSPLWPALTVTQAREKDDDADTRPLREFRFQLPPALLRDEPATITVEWVDFYRG